MPSSDLAYKALHAALDTKSKRGDAPQLHDDIFVEASGPTSTTVYMFMVRATTSLGAGDLQHHYGVFANVDKRAATPPRVDTIIAADVVAFLEAAPPIALYAAPVGDHASGGATYEVRVRNHHVDITIHFANPRHPRADLVALAKAVRDLIALQTS